MKKCIQEIRDLGPDKNIQMIDEIRGAVLRLFPVLKSLGKQEAMLGLESIDEMVRDARWLYEDFLRRKLRLIGSTGNDSISKLNNVADKSKMNEISTDIQPIRYLESEKQECLDFFLNILRNLLNVSKKRLMNIDLEPRGCNPEHKERNAPDLGSALEEIQNLLANVNKIIEFSRSISSVTIMELREFRSYLSSKYDSTDNFEPDSTIICKCGSRIAPDDIQDTMICSHCGRQLR